MGALHCINAVGAHGSGVTYVTLYSVYRYHCPVRGVGCMPQDFRIRVRAECGP